MHDLFVCLLWSQVGFEHVAAIEFGGFCLRVFINSQGYGALLYGQYDPVSDAQGCGTGHELLPRTLDIGARLVGKVLIVLGNKRLESNKISVPGVSDLLVTDGIPSEHIAVLLLRD